jgi:methionyl aminopeptidase
MHLKPTADNTIVLKSPREIAIMREAGRVVANTIRAIEEQAEAGMTTRDLDQIAAHMFKDAGAESTALGYFGYPGHICVSVNDEVVHGIPGPRKLKRGDLVKVDVAARYRGYVGDSTHCFAIGGMSTLPPRVRELVQVTQEALFHGIDQARPGNRLSDIGAAIEAHVRKHGMSVVRDFVGHGVGRNMHEAPQVQHHGPGGRGPILRPGMCLAIEPQVNLGSPAVRMLEDGWTAVTVDGSMSAHFEHTVAITPDGPWVLTAQDGGESGFARYPGTAETRLGDTRKKDPESVPPT